MRMNLLDFFAFSGECGAVSTISGEEFGTTSEAVAEYGVWMEAAALLLSGAVLILILVLILMLIRNAELRKYRRIFEMIPVRTGICDSSGKILFFQRNSTSGASVPADIGELPEELQKELRTALSEFFVNRKAGTREFSVFNSRKKIELLPMPDSLFGVPSVMWILSDITDLHRAYSECAVTLERFRRTVNSIGDAVIVTNCDGEITMANPVAAAFLGCSPEELAGRRFDICFPLDLEKESSPVERVIRTGTAFRFDSRLSVRGKNEISVEGMISPVTEDDSLVIGTVLCFRDVSALIRSRLEIRSALEFARTADRAKSDILATMNHDFRSSLNNIIGSCELMAPDFKGDSSIGPGCVRGEAERLLRLLDDMLDLSRLDLDSVNLRIEPVDLRNFCTELERIFEKTAANRSVPLRVSVPENPPLVMSDYKALRQELVRVLSWSYAMTEQGEIQLNLLWDPPELTFETVFRRTSGAVFGESVTPADIPLVQNICERLGGILKMTRDGENNILRLIFPDLECRERGTPDALPPAVHPGKNASRRNLVLLVDDLPLNLKIMEKLLDTLGVAHVSCSSVREAVAEIGKYLPSAVLTDLRMPDAGGDELARILSRDPATDGIPLLLITADNHLNRETAELFDRVVQKPLSLPVIAGILRESVPSLFDGGGFVR